MPSTIVSPTGNPVVDSLIIEHAWSGSEISYSFGFSDIDMSGIPDLDEGDWKAFYRELLADVERFTALRFVEVAAPGNINFKLEAGGGGYSGGPGPGAESVDTVVGIDPNVAGAAEVVRLGTFSVTWFHELGHALGLAHTHDETSTPKLPGVDEPDDHGTGNLNSHLYTVMGYTHHFLGEDNPFTVSVDPGVALNAQSGSFGAIDIATLQHMYGTRASNTGNDTYQFGDDVDFNQGYKAIWDTAGSDTIQYVGSNRAKIDLRDATLKPEIGGGGWTSTSQTLTGGFTIANGVRIENATGGSADDVIVGNGIANILKGLAGDDTVNGGADGDLISGGDGSDVVNGNTGNDFIDGGGGRDQIQGGQGNDTINGDVGHDMVSGDRGDDTINGNAGNDALNGGAGNDNVRGGQGNDLVQGGQGIDILFGDLGNDHLSGDFGNDKMTGGVDADVFEFRTNQGNDVITDFNAAEGDRLVLFGQAFTAVDDGTSTTLFLSGGGTIVLTGVTGDEFGAQFVV